MSFTSPICRRPSDAVFYWNQNVVRAGGGDLEVEKFWVIALDDSRRFTKIFEPGTRVFGDPARFADELFAEIFLRYASEIVLIHHRPGVPPTPGDDDIARVRAIILAGREKKIELLDAILIGTATDEHSAGCFSFHQLPGFEAENPFKNQDKSASPAGEKVHISHANKNRGKTGVQT